MDVSRLISWITFCFFAVNAAKREGHSQIFFPRESPNIAPPCVAYDGQQGECRLLVQCATFFAEIAELSRSPCTISDQQQGVCCPPTKTPTRDPVTIAAKRPHVPNPAIVFPELSQQEIHSSCQHGIATAGNKEIFFNDLVDRNIIAERGSPVFWHSRLFECSDEVFEKGKNAALVLEASKDLKNDLNLSKEQAEDGLQEHSIINTIIQDACPPPPRCPDPNHRYRTMDGSCNNINKRDWGRTASAFTRMLPADYKDGISEPRVSVRNGPLPSPRVVSTFLSPAKTDVYLNLTNLIWQWGQFLDHDITHTPLSKGSRKSDISCCIGGNMRNPNDMHDECLPIEIPANDPFYGKFGLRCMGFVRSMPGIREGCKFGPREQMNQITSYHDASNVYGSTDRNIQNLRSFQGGLLKINWHGGRELLPALGRGGGCVPKSQVEQCFLAGDTRVNEQPNLVVMHTIWMRQHNKIAKELLRLNPLWSDELLFQEARRIVAAQMQHITYNEYVPVVLGREFSETWGLIPLKNGYFRGYREDVDATIINAFAAAAFRYGHTLITDHLQGFGKFGNLKRDDPLSSQQFKPFSLYQPNTLDELIRGLSLQQSQKFDRFFSEELTNKLFAQDRPSGLDLVAMNIQRGRDHGLPAYHKWRQICELNPVRTWNDLLNDGIMSQDGILQLQKIYASVEDIDLFIGGITENSVPGTLLGPTFLCIIGRQFIKLKIGDRFYYENGFPGQQRNPGSPELPSSFTEGQLSEIRKTSLARILCDNSDNVELMQPLAFVTAHFVNKRAACNSNILIPRISLNPWKNIIMTN